MSPARGQKGRFQVVFGAVGTITAEGKVLYHKLGDVIDLAEDEAERLLGLGAVVDTQGKSEDELKASAPADSAPQTLPTSGGVSSPPGLTAEDVKASDNKA